MSLTGWVLRTLGALGKQALRTDRLKGLSPGCWDSPGGWDSTCTFTPGASAPGGAPPHFRRSGSASPRLCSWRKTTLS